MPKFYFDFHDDDDTGTTDEVGVPFPSIHDARKEAVSAIGDAVRDFSRHNREGCLRIVVRDAKGPLLEVLAALKIRPTK